MGTETDTYDYDEIWRENYGEMQDCGPVHRHMRRLVVPLLEKLSYKTALEVGCGAGHNLPLIHAAGSPEEIAGVDISSEALGRARAAWPSGHFEELDIQAGHLPGKWDLIFSSLVLEHVPDDRAALQNMRAMTDGHLLITTISGDFERYRPWEEQMGHVRNYKRGELEEKMEAAGFEVLDAIYWGFPFYAPLARRLQNGMSAEPEFGTFTRLISSVMFGLYFLNSRRRGDLLIMLARAN